MSLCQCVSPKRNEKPETALKFKKSFRVGRFTISLLFVENLSTSLEQHHPDLFVAWVRKLDIDLLVGVEYIELG